MAPLAHISHWYAEILYVLPVVLVVAWLAISGWREKRRGGDATDDGHATPDGTA